MLLASIYAFICSFPHTPTYQSKNSLLKNITMDPDSNTWLTQTQGQQNICHRLTVSSLKCRINLKMPGYNNTKQSTHTLCAVTRRVPAEPKTAAVLIQFFWLATRSQNESLVNYHNLTTFYTILEGGQETMGIKDGPWSKNIAIR